MSDSLENHLRVELTVLDPKLFRERAEWRGRSRCELIFCTPYEDAVSPPFPAEGKTGLSVWVGPLSAFRKPRVRQLWELEKRRKRPTMVVLTSQKGRSFLRAFREVGTLLGDTSIAPISFLRRRGQEWDSLDFLSSGDSSFMDGANPRLRRLKQAGWEYMVDRVCQIAPQVKTEYFETLQIGRDTLINAATTGFCQLKLSPLVGIAGECLTKDSLFGLLEEPLIGGLLDQVDGQAPLAPGSWLLLADRGGGSELLFLGHATEALAVGQILEGQDGGGLGNPSGLQGVAVSVSVSVTASGRGKAKNEFAVAEIKQRLLSAGDHEAAKSFCWVKVDWRYPPEREIPTLWKQKSVISAGSTP